MTNNTAFTFITIDQVVKAHLKSRPILHYQAEAAEIAHFYGAGILIEQTANCYFNRSALVERLEELQPTEDAEVLSVETVSPVS